MLTIIRSNAVEALFGQLMHRLAAAPPASPFAPEVVVAASPAMARWLSLQTARALGVAANVDYPLPASFIWRLARQLLDDLPRDDPLAVERMAWKLFELLPELLGQSEPRSAFAPLTRYLADDAEGLKRWQLSGRIADCFDRYQLYRPSQIRDWEAGADDHWQALLWRGLTRGLDDLHRVAVIDRLLAALDTTAAVQALPERLSLFALSSLPPLFVQVIQALSAHIPVDLYLHSPTDAFWSDLISQKALARKRLQCPEDAELWEVGNSLLASWGRQGQALQDLLLEHEHPLQEVDAFIEPSCEGLLGRLQHDIFALCPVPAPDERPRLDDDDSLQVHVCHSPARECQVLRDQLLGMLEADADLRPEQILVMVPEISRYAPYIEAVFDCNREREPAQGVPFIPWNLSDITVADEHPLVNVFLQLLALPDSRFSQSEVMSYLAVPELAGHFGLDADALAQIRRWLAQANLRWGLGAEHKRRLGLPGEHANTWAQAEQRLFGGYALGDSGLFEGIAPIGGVEGSGAEALGKFWRLFCKLTETAERLSAPRTAADWQVFVSGLLSDFFGERDDDDGRLQKIRDALSDLVAQADGLEEPLHPALLRSWLRESLGGESRHGRYFSGGVTFCGMRPLRSLPFKVICVLGLHDQAFPRRDRPAEFDLMRSSWRPGDPRKADEDRYLFLETLLCARERLYLSYVGRDIRGNSERQPSVLVRELLDTIDQYYRPVADAGDDTQRLSARLVRVHPLQPFSPRHYVGAERSYDRDWCEVARALLQAPAPADHAAKGWSQAVLPPAPEQMRDVTLTQLERFLAHPIRYFVNSRLRVYLREQEPQPDEEPFGLDALQRFGLKQQLVASKLLGWEPGEQQLSAEGILPHGAFAGLALQQQRAALSPLLERLAPYSTFQPEQIAVDLMFETDAENAPRGLSGQLAGIYPDLGLLRWKPSAIKGADLLKLWLAHLGWCAVGEPGDKCSSLHGLGGSFVIQQTLAPRAARAALLRLLDLYWQGIHRPLLLLPRASFAYAETCHKGGRADPMNAAHAGWVGNHFNDIPGDRDDAYIQLVMRGTDGDPLRDADFERLANAFFGDVLRNGAFS